MDYDLIKEQLYHPENFQSDEAYVDNLRDHLQLAKDNHNIYQINRLTKMIDAANWEILREKLK